MTTSEYPVLYVFLFLFIIFIFTNSSLLLRYYLIGFLGHLDYSIDEAAASVSLDGHVICSKIVIL